MAGVGVPSEASGAMNTTGGRTIVLMYHRIGSEAPDPHGLQVSAENFADQLEVLISRAQLVRLDEVLQPSDVRLRVAVTFDDGYRDNLLAALPVLRAAQVPATVFVTSGFLGDPKGFWIDRLVALLLRGTPRVEHAEMKIGGRALLLDVHSKRARERAYRFLHGRLKDLSPELIDRELDELGGVLGTDIPVSPTALPLTVHELHQLAEDPLVTIGAHSLRHPRLASLEPQAQREEIVGSGDELASLLGIEISEFAYPYGAPDTFNDYCVKIARERYRLAVTTEQGTLATSTDPHRVPRLNVGNWARADFEWWLDSWS